MARGIERFRIRISELLGAQDREILGTLIIERIIDRTLDGRDIEGRSFRRYSRSYTDELTTIGANTTPDLELTGEMLNSIQVLSHGPGFVEIGLPEGSFAAQKARWNQGGNRRIPSRPFLGIEDSEAEVIEDQVASGSPVVQAQRFLEENSIVDRIFANITLGN